MNRNFFVQAFKYGIVGLTNTLLTLGIIWLMREVFHAPLVLSNAIGYVAGFLNSFLLNRSWTFKSNADWKKGLLKFLLMFLFCYSIQLGVVLLLEKYTSLPESYCTVIGMIVYTTINFFCNKYYTFKK